MDARQRRELTRYGAPAAFLAAVTVAVLLIKAGLGGSHAATTEAAPPTSAATTTAAATTAPRTTTAAATYYTIQPGDTLGAIASRAHTTVAELLRLNPGIDPRSLHSGQRIRVG
jgi:peptidoglycan endopeptidase LytE